MIQEALKLKREVVHTENNESEAILRALKTFGKDVNNIKGYDDDLVIMNIDKQ
jgi:hypothetical protein